MEVHWGGKDRVGGVQTRRIGQQDSFAGGLRGEEEIPRLGEEIQALGETRRFGSQGAAGERGQQPRHNAVAERQASLPLRYKRRGVGDGVAQQGAMEQRPLPP